MRTPAEYLDRYTEPVTESGCIIWTGKVNQAGYGQLPVNGKMKVVHRFVYESLHGPVPRELYVCHHCDVPSCCNPDHLFVGTNRENQLDSIRKGRYMTAKRIAGLDVTHAKKVGVPCTVEHKAKVSASLIGNTRTLGHTLSPEHRARISAGLREYHNR